MTCEICYFIINGMQHLDKSIRAKAISRWNHFIFISFPLFFFSFSSFSSSLLLSILCLLPSLTIDRFKVKFAIKNETFFYYLLSSTSLNIRTMFRCKLWRESLFGCIVMCFVVANTSLTSKNSFFVNPMTLRNWFFRFFLFLSQKLSLVFLPLKIGNLSIAFQTLLRF